MLFSYITLLAEHERTARLISTIKDQCPRTQKPTPSMHREKESSGTLVVAQSLLERLISKPYPFQPARHNTCKCAHANRARASVRVLWGYHSTANLQKAGDSWGLLSVRARGVSSCFFFSSRRRHTCCYRDWSSDVCSSDLSATESRRATRSTASRTNGSRGCRAV